MAERARQLLDHTGKKTRFFGQSTVIFAEYMHVYLSAHGTDEEIVLQLVQDHSRGLLLRNSLQMHVGRGRYPPVLDYLGAILPELPVPVRHILEQIFENVSLSQEFYDALLDGPQGILHVAIKASVYVDRGEGRMIDQLLTGIPSLVYTGEGDERLSPAQAVMLVSTLRPPDILVAREYPRLLARFPRGGFCDGVYETPYGRPRTLLGAAAYSNNVANVRITLDHIGPRAKTTRDHSGLTPLEAHIHTIESRAWNYAHGMPDPEIEALLTVSTKGAHE